ncbi:hypothetical protein ACQZ4Q_24705, partial [Agrobacterium vitis]
MSGQRYDARKIIKRFQADTGGEGDVGLGDVAARLGLVELEGESESMRLGITHRAVYAILVVPNRTHRHQENMSDNVALSDVLLIIEKWPTSSSKTAKFTSRRAQRRLSAR